mmetsp:Transcript_32341/g.75065  ORF Transcript_32341/g.75065 Transcript_32341/m.75065 type:complete len:177 (+) Transcript_32341:38-568(+)|eukprot:CAMPEP_0171102976 /NCGR_PEP_ID=MMETSP0766_2-20121228/58667_1 /TAXON_ID=439317 /ORGANISM="Gambierdiscus australes, Strain CAWD 149" /LENGTH=176 /DNA_ID=CAMNT_0011563363 /DNA_START=35 /DNA_END=565 /DNA_ORIENTATION=+
MARQSPSSTLSRSASQPQTSAGVPVKRMDIHGRAAEIVALSYLYAPSSTGSLQHDHLRRMQQVLEDVDEQQTVGRGATSGPDRDRQWTKSQLAERKAARQGQPASVESQWRLRRGQWYFEGGAPPEEVSADEGLRRWREEEERRGRGKQYRNGVAAPGQMRRFHNRNPSGGFYDDT